MNVTKDISIEELVENKPGSVKYLMEKGIRCIACGEPIWGTPEEAAKETGYKTKEISEIVKDLNNLGILFCVLQVFMVFQGIIQKFP